MIVTVSPGRVIVVTLVEVVFKVLHSDREGCWVDDGDGKVALKGLCLLIILMALKKNACYLPHSSYSKDGSEGRVVRFATGEGLPLVGYSVLVTVVPFLKGVTWYVIVTVSSLTTIVL